MKNVIILVVRRASLLSAVSMSCVAALTAAAKDLPKMSVSDQAIDRSVQGASYANVIKRVTPSVVTIESTRTVRPPANVFNDPRLRRFFGGEEEPGPDNPRKMRQESLGSGVIVSEEGYILTNNHVVEGADEDGVKIAMADGKTRYNAKVVGKDPRTDIAILKIEAAKKLPALTLADSDKLEVGDVVLAVGNPFGFGQSVSSGIISALSRGFGILGNQGYEDFIQTDASINQGNSGGALVDSEGRLIGINQSIASPSGANAGVGFAVPINLARSVMEQLITDGKVVRGFLGVYPQTVTPELAKSFNLMNASGALIGEVQTGTPAAKAGMLEGDIIIEFNKKPVTDAAHFRLMVAQTPPKTSVTFKALRDGKEKNFTVTLAALPDERAVRSHDRPDSTDAETDVLDGVEVTDLDAPMRQRFNVPQRIRGALVAKVDEDSNAAEAGLRPGDVIVELNRRPVKSADDAVEVATAAKGDRILVRVYSQSGGTGSTRYLSVETTKPKK